MQDIAKTLYDIAKAVENNETVESVKIVITVKKQKPHKVSEKPEVK